MSREIAKIPNKPRVEFPSKSPSNPRIYAYSDHNPDYKGLLKIGYTTRTVQQRVAEQYIDQPVKSPYTIVLDEPAVKNDGTTFTDKTVHKYLQKAGFNNPNGEWFECSVANIKNAIAAICDDKQYAPERIYSFAMRPEQQQAVEKTVQFFRSCGQEIPHFLWNAKMRFGKTFTAYQLAKRMDWTKILVLTFKPAVQNAWEQDLLSHTDFSGWQFISKDGTNYHEINKSKPFVWFASFQDLLGKNQAGGIKPKNENAHAIHWDCVIFDEYHFGAWRESAKELFELEDSTKPNKEQDQEQNNMELLANNTLPITTNHYLYLSGTPFKSIANGEFIEEQIYNWTYSDEQKAKIEWIGEDNPYKALPRMVMMTYEMPPEIKQIALDTELNEFDLNEFFSAEPREGKDIFKHEGDVQKWLDLIRGADLPTAKDNLQLGGKTPPFPYSDVNLLSALTHTFWFLPNITSCNAMERLLQQKHNTFYKDYKIINASGPKAGIGVEALEPLQKTMANPFQTKTITLSCGKLTTGVSVKPWSGIFMLRNLQSPETYFQAAFRVQTPWVIDNPDGKHPEQKEIIKPQCYVFDFAPNRALRQIADYSCRLDINESNPENKVAEFIHFLPVLAYTDGSMKQIDASSILDITKSGTSATLLAKRWQSALLVNVDNMTLARLLDNREAMAALMSIEGFRSLNQDIEIVISKSKEIKKYQRTSKQKGFNETRKEKTKRR